VVGHTQNIDLGGPITEAVRGGGPASAAAPAPAPRAVDPEARERALAVVARALASHGGRERLSALARLRIRGRSFVRTPQGELELPAVQSVAYPDRLRIEIETPMGPLVQAWDGAEGWMRTPDGAVVPLPARARDDMLLSLRTETIPLLLELAGLRPSSAAGGREPLLEHTGIETINDRRAETLHAKLPVGESGLLAVELAFELETGHLIRRTVERAGTLTITDFADQREIGGVLLPHKIRRQEGGVTTAAVTVDEVELDPELPEAHFARPSD
jgi:hypothetical protein